MESGQVTVILSEPGAGKTTFLNAMAARHGTRTIRASVARHRPLASDRLLVIDALDEVARQDPGALDELLAKTIEASSGHVVLASRSAEWSEAQSELIVELTGAKPRFAYLIPLDRTEQAAIFHSLFQDENFETFLDEVEKVGLAGLLGNPMFLLLFVEGFIQGGRQLHSKARTFQDAVERLAIEQNPRPAEQYRPPVREALRVASEMFAKLLLAGASGVGTIERLKDDDFPYVASLSTRNDVIPAVLDSRLFRPTGDVAQHEPVHRIIAEYCAACDLNARIANPRSQVTLSRCLALIAPNGVVRDDLRGLLGWLAALGAEATQAAIVDLDPYAVIANGDPGALTTKVKRRLLLALQTLADQDPYFRRSDAWRSFNAAGFFTPDMSPEVNAILSGGHSHRIVVQLLLELIMGEPIVTTLVTTLCQLVSDSGLETETRRLAAHCLKDHSKTESIELAMGCLLAEGTMDGLKVFGDLTSEAAVETETLVALLRGCQRHLDDENAWLDVEYLLRRTLFNVTDTQALGEALSTFAGSIQCDCTPEHVFGCRCREAPSRIASLLMDRYFELADGSVVPELVWGWLQNLHFGTGSRPHDGAALRALQSSSMLRRRVQELCMVGGGSTPTGRFALLRHGLLHPGLSMTEGDTHHLVDAAFRAGNVEVWSSFIRPHRRHGDARSVDSLRTTMRGHANQNTIFMAAWSRLNRFWRRETPRDTRMRRLSNRSARRRQEREDDRSRHLLEHRLRIQRGESWGWNQEFAYKYLNKPERLEDYELAEDALANGIDKLAPYTPTLAELARGEKTHIAMVLQAGCLVMFRRGLSLEGLDKDILLAVKTQARFSNEYGEGERERFEAAIDRVVMFSPSETEAFARSFIGASLNAEGPDQLWWLSAEERFHGLAGPLAVEWLSGYPDLPLQKLESLFEIAVQFAPREWLVRFIEERCDAVLSARPSADSPESEHQTFWFLRHFFFATSDRDGIWDLLLRDKMIVLALEHRTSALQRSRHAAWPQLDSIKAFRVLSAQVTNWPTVPLPSHWGTSSPRSETAYRYLRDLVWLIDRDHADRSLPVIEQLLGDDRFDHFEQDLKSIRTAALRRRALEGFYPPRLPDISAMLEAGTVASVEDMRALLKEQLESFQRWIDGAETNPREMFWPGGKRVDENTARNRIVERLTAQLEALGQSVVIEHHMSNDNRCDFTVTKVSEGKRLLLVCEVKGQWHPALFTAASEQLDALYTTHPDAAQQGVYLVLWVGGQEKIAGRKSHGIASAAALRERIVDSLDSKSAGRLDVVVLDLENKVDSTVERLPDARSRPAWSTAPRIAGRRAATPERDD